MGSDRDIDQGCTYDLAIGSLFRDEAPYLKEWIEFHRMMGVQLFVLVDDRSEDNYLTILQHYIDRGEVELFHRPCPENLRGRGWIQYQWAVICALLDRLRGVSRWLALIDTDEFIVPTETGSLIDYLNDYEDCGGIYVRWEPFGTSHVPRLSASDLLTERMVLKWKFVKGYEMLGKSIVKPHRVLRPNIHNCELLPEYEYVDSNPRMEDESPEIKLHHYWTRDEHFFFNEKLPRTAKIKGWEINQERIEYFKRLFNDVQDDSMKRFLPELRRRVFSDHCSEGVE
jgi:Glycosyltransferase family 92